MTAQRTVTICNRRGLHARASAKFVTLASNQSAQVEVEKDGSKVAGTSIMGLMMLGADAGGADHQRRARSDRGAEMIDQGGGDGEIDQHVAGLGQGGGIAFGIDPAGGRGTRGGDRLFDRAAHPPRAAVDTDPAHHLALVVCGRSMREAGAAVHRGMHAQDDGRPATRSL